MAAGVNRMREALRVFRKDAGHLWPQAAGLAALLAAACWQDARLPGHGASGLHAALDAAFPLACLYLAACLIHAEAPAGDRAYWLTRPFSRRSLLAAKALWLATFVNLPVLVAQSVTLAANGLSPWDHLSILLWRQVFLTAEVLLPAAALAAVTRNLAEFAAAAFLVFMVIVPWTLLRAATDWTAWEWVRGSITGVAALGAAGAVLALQYARRDTGLSRAILGAAAVAIGLWQMVPWHVGLAVESALWRTAPGAVARLAFAPERRRAAEVHGLAGRLRSTIRVPIEIPVEISGIPADQGVIAQAIRITVDAPGGSRWDSGWESPGQPVLSGEAAPARPLPASDGPCWLRMAIDPAFYQTVGNQPVHLRATVALTLVGDATSTVLELGAARIAADTGVCWTHPSGARVTVVCFSPFWRPAWSRLRVQSKSTGESVSAGLTAPDISYGPFPTAAGLSMWGWAAGGTSAPAFPIAVILDTHPAAGFAERTVDVPALRLADYQGRGEGGRE